MRRVYKNKKAFTLVEMMLAIAIIMLTMDAFYGLILMSYQAHLKVFNTNDATDYAMLNARAIENVLVQAKEFSSGSGAHKVSCDGTIATLDNAPMFTMTQVTYADGSAKWKLDITFTPGSQKGEISYTIKVYDNYYNPGNLTTTYSSTVWVPHCDSTLSGETNTVYLSYNN